jgi:hypothetical protein
MYGETKVVSDYRAFGCRAWVYLDKQHQEKGKHTPKAKEAVYVEFVPNMSAWAFWIPADKKKMTTNQAISTSMNSLPEEEDGGATYVRQFH